MKNPLVDTTAGCACLGRFALPLTISETVWNLSSLTPIQVPRFSFVSLARTIEQCFSEADYRVRFDGKIAQVTPEEMVLSPFGQGVLDQLAAKHQQSRPPISSPLKKP